MISSKDLQDQEYKDKQVVELGLRHGDNPLTERPIDHFFYFNTKTDAQTLSATAKQYEYSVSGPQARHDEDQQKWFVLVTGSAALDAESLSRETTFMLKLAHDHNADYDGWGCPVMNVEKY